MTRSRSFLRIYGTLLVYGIALLLCIFSMAGCTSTQRATFKAHALETGIAAGSGALAVATGGVAAIPIFIGGMGTAALVGEVQKPPPQTEHTTTVVDDNGKILSQKTTIGSTKAAPTTMEAVLSWLTAKVLIILALVVIALVFPASRAATVSALGAALQVAKKGTLWIGAHLKSTVTQKPPVKPAMRSSKSSEPNDPINPK